MRRLLVAAVLAVVLVVPAQASAVSFSASYCKSMLRGETAVAPDNDVKIVWDKLESANGWNITSSWAADWFESSGDGWFVIWRYYRANGATYDRLFQCYRDPAWHDVDLGSPY